MTELANYSVPTEPFKELILKWCEDHETDITNLSVACGFSRDTIGALFNKKDRSTCGFDTMDKIICLTYGPLLWRDEPFRTIYWQGNPPPDESKPIRCGNPRCSEWIEFNLNDTWGQGRLKKYCSKKCKGLVYKDKFRKSLRVSDAARAKQKYWEDEEYREKQRAKSRKYYQENAERERERSRLNREKKRAA